MQVQGQSWVSKWGPLFAAAGEGDGTNVPSGTDEPTGTPSPPEDGGPPGDNGEPPPQDPPTADPPADPPPAPEQTVPLSRLNEATAATWAARRQAEQEAARAALAEEQLRQLRALAAGEDPSAAPAPAASGVVVPGSPEFQAAVREASALEAFNTQCNAAAAHGKSAHVDFDASLVALRGFVGGTIPREFVETALEVGGTEGASEIIYALGKNLVKADEILRKPPRQQVLALAELVKEVKKPPTVAVSSAPAPIRSATGGGGNTSAKRPLTDTKQPIEDWIAQREVEVQEEQKRKRA